MTKKQQKKRIKSNMICLKRKLDLDFKPVKRFRPSETKSFREIESSQEKDEEEVHNSTLVSSSNWSSELPDEILFKIFRYHSYNAQGDLRKINNLKIVCKNWNRVASDLRLLHHIDLSKLYYKLSIKRVVNSSNLTFLMRLNLNSLKEFTCDDLVKILNKTNSNLKELNIANCVKITDSKKNLNFIKQIADLCPRLNCLNLTGMKKQLKQNDLLYLFQKLNTNLIHLNISQNYITQAMLIQLSENCSNLETIDISNCDPLSPILKTKFNLDLFMSNCPNIKHFRMLNCSLQTNYDSIQKVVESGELCTNLVEFSSGLGLIHPFYTEHLSTNFLLFMMAKLCKDAANLKKLDLRAYKSPLNSQINLFDLIKSNVLEMLFLCNANLSEADNFYLSQAISTKWCNSLIVLDLSWCNITKEYLEKIFDIFIQNSTTVKLKSLTLVGTCVDTQMIKNLISKVKSLEYVDLSSCRSVERGMKKNNSIDELNTFFNNFST